MVRPLRLIGHCVQIILVYRNANDKSTTHGMVISVDASNCWHHLGRTATARVKSVGCWARSADQTKAPPPYSFHMEVPHWLVKSVWGS